MPFALTCVTMRAKNPTVLCFISALSGAAFVALSQQVSRRRTSRQDREVREELRRRRRPLGDVVAHATNPLGKEWLHIPSAVALSLYVARKGRGYGKARGAFVPVVASVAAEVLSQALDRLPPHRRPPAGHPQPYKPSFPSGHALETTAVAGASAYVLARENLAEAPAAFATAAGLSLASTFGRLYLDRHWASDAVAGTALGLSIAAACAAMYEVAASRKVDATVTD
jgi:membrane-associated phospholipid phosphatase